MSAEHCLISHECSMSTGSTVIATYVGTIKSIHLIILQQNDPKSSMTEVLIQNSLEW